LRANTHIKTNPRLTINNATNHDILPPLVADLLTDPVTYIDNQFADGWKQLGLTSLIGKSGIAKRTGVDVNEAVYLLLVWRWLTVSSISMFAQKALGLFSQARKDVMYDLLKREDVNWRELNLLVARKVCDEHSLDSGDTQAFVLDDSIKALRGKRMEGVSSHFDHVSNTSVKGQQVLTMGLSTDQGFLPLDSQISVSDVRASELNRPFKDGRSVGAKRYEEAVGKSKAQIATGMIHRAVRSGIRAAYVVADALFGNKEMIRASLKLKMTAVLRMKKGNMKYRVNSGNRYVKLDAKALYKRAVRKQWQEIPDMPWKAVEMVVELDLAKGKGVKVKPEYCKVKLLFVRGIHETDDRAGSSKDWALFLTTDIKMTMSRMLVEIYALRWSIEVYFKETKQHLGFLKEQTRSFVSHTASIHLCAIRYLMLVDGKFRCEDASVGAIRAQVQDQLDSLHFAAKLWKVFRALVAGTLKSMRAKLPCGVAQIMDKLDDRVTQFFGQALQLDTMTMKLEHT